MPPCEPLARSVAAMSCMKASLVGAGDEALDAVDHVVVAVAHGGGAHAAGIGAGVGLGLREADLLLAAQHRQQVFLLQLAGERVEDARARPGR